MLWETLSPARDLGRLHDLASVLVRYGFGDLARRLGMAHALERAGHVIDLEQVEELVSLSPPVRVRRALEEMGPSFVKLGQILATRVDLFAPEWIAEFEKLQNIDIKRLETLGGQVDHSVNRLTIGIVIAALIIGSSIVLTVSGGPTLLGLPLFGLVGFLCAVVGSFWLLYSIWRSGGGR